MTTPRNRNPMGLEELREVHRDLVSTLEQITEAMDAMRESPNHQGLLATLYTKALLAKTRVQVDMERLT